LWRNSSAVGVALLPPFPNPFHAETTRDFCLPLEQAVQLVVFNLIGQQVRELLVATRGAGVHEVV